MKQLNLIVLVLAALIARSNANAAEAAESSAHIAIINMPRAIQTVAEGKKARETLQKEWEAEQKRLQGEGKKIQTAMEEFRKQSMVLDEKSRQEKEEGIQKRIMELREAEAKSSGEFQKRDQQVSEPIIKKIKNLVAQVSKQRNYTLVMDGNENLVIYSGNTDDITDDIIKLYDGKK